MSGDIQENSAMDVRDAAKIIANEIAPTLAAQVSGEFQVVVHASDGTFCRVELRICNPKNKDDVRHSFGFIDTEIGRPITLEGIESTINFLPKGVN